METRLEQALDGAIRVLGTRGVRQLTHRAVDAEAGLPAGSTSNYFRTREALLAGVLTQLGAWEVNAWNRFASTLDEELGIDAFADAVGQLIRQLAGPSRVITLARQAILLESAFSPELQNLVGTGRVQLETWGSDWIRRLGSPVPVRDFWLLMALIDGLLSQQNIAPDPDFDPAPAIRALLTGLCEGWTS